MIVVFELFFLVLISKNLIAGLNEQSKLAEVRIIIIIYRRDN